MAPECSSSVDDNVNILFSVASAANVNNHQQMVDALRHESIEDRFTYLLSLAGWTRPDFNKLPGAGRANVSNWLNRGGGFSDAGIALVRQWCEAHGIQGFTSDWLNDGIPPAPRRLAPQAIADGDRFGEVVDRINKLKPSSRTTQELVQVRFAWLEGYPQPSTPFIDIYSFLLPKDPSITSATVRCFINPGDAMRGEIEKGDLVFVDTADTQLEADGIYVYKLGGIAHIRRILIRDKGLLRIQGTKSFEDSLELSGAKLKELEIGGRVIGRIGGNSI